MLASLDENGTWIYKSRPYTPPPIKKKDGKGYRDRPQYPVIYAIEDKFKKRGRKMITEIAKDLTKSLLNQ